MADIAAQPLNVSNLLRKFWLHAMIGLALFAIVSYVLFWKVYPLSASSSAANGLVLGVWGVLLSLIGFAFTIWQLHRTQTAADAAVKAVTDLKGKMSAFNSIVEAQKAITYIQETQRHIRVPSWNSAAISYSGAKEAILRLSELSSTISENDKRDLSSMLADITAISDKIDTGLINGSFAIDRGRALRGCRNHEESLIKLSIGLEKEI